MLQILCAYCFNLPPSISAQSMFEICVVASNRSRKLRKTSLKIAAWILKSFKVINVGTPEKPVSGAGY